jgi:glucose/arabinose dehydrogenase
MICILIAALSFILLLVWFGLIALGVALLLKRRWIGFGWLTLGLLLFVVQTGLSLIPVGIGEPLIRIPVDAYWIATGVALLASVAALAVLRARLPRVPWQGLLLTPVVAGLALWGVSYLSIPERERERDPAKRPIRVSPGFQIERYASAADAGGAMDNPTVLAFGEGGRLFIGDIDGNVWTGVDANGDQQIDGLTRYTSGYQLLVGLLWLNGELYVSSAGKIEALRDTDGDGMADARRTVTDGLPALVVQPHSNNSLTLGPDGQIYFGIGSTSLTGPEVSPLGGAIVSVSPDGGPARVFAQGFGNSFDLAFNSQGRLFAGDNAGPARNGDADPDEFNQIEQGGNYGPADRETDPLNITSGRREPLLTFPAHSTPTGMTIYSGKAFPPEYVDQAFVALWNRGEVMRIELNDRGDGSYVGRSRLFVDGLLYPIEVTQGPDDALYIADFGTSTVYRVSYVGP